jgi:NADH dehydrogenase (ubiquinone) Fe-S protein 2
MQGILQLKSYKLNFGPQHPSAHGVLRLVLYIIGEVVFKTDPHVGLLHRGTEKLIEVKSYKQALPYFDRLDYVSMMIQEHAFTLVIEKIKKASIPIRAQYIRVIFSEITRILNHIMSLTTHALDVGALTPFLWGFEEREKLMSFYEEITGARMHSSYIIPGGIKEDIPYLFISNLRVFITTLDYKLNEIEELLSENRIWYERLTNIGIVTSTQAKGWGFSGVFLRAAGINWDLRINTPYEQYSKIKFAVPLGYKGDCFDRFLVRVEEIRQSVRIINTCLNLISKGPILSSAFNHNITNKEINKGFMELVIGDFKHYSEGLNLGYGNNYTSLESPKGEFGVFLLLKEYFNIHRCKIKSPGF